MEYAFKNTAQEWDKNIPGIYTWIIGAGFMAKAKIKLTKWNLRFLCEIVQKCNFM